MSLVLPVFSGADRLFRPLHEVQVVFAQLPQDQRSEPPVPDHGPAHELLVVLRNPAIFSG